MNLEDAGRALMARAQVRPTRPGLKGVWLALYRASDNVDSAVVAAALEAAAEAVRKAEAGSLSEADAMTVLTLVQATLDQAGY